MPVALAYHPVDGMTFMDRTMTAIGTLLMMVVVLTEIQVQTLGSRRLLYAVFVAAVPRVAMLRAGMTLMDRTMTALTTRLRLFALPSEMDMQTLGTQQILHAVLVVAAVLGQTSVALAYHPVDGIIEWRL
jgi:hypothetical protein